MVDEEKMGHAAVGYENGGSNRIGKEDYTKHIQVLEWRVYKGKKKSGTLVMFFFSPFIFTHFNRGIFLKILI